MLRFVTGVPGAGKSLYTVSKLVEELRSTKRPIITNLPIRVVPWVRGNKAQIGLKGYLLAKYGKDFDCEARIHILPEDEVREFWRWRVVEGKLVKLAVQYERPGDPKSNVLALEGGAESEPCVYVIDEAWQYFGARNWQELGRGIQWYLAQHRKWGDDVWITTQHYNQVDKQLRMLVAEFHECVNHLQRKMLLWRHPGLIRVAVSNDPPERQGRLTSEEKYFRLDKKGLCACYDTAAGAGVKGAVADIGKRSKGLPLWTILVVILIGCLFLRWAPDAMGRRLSGKMAHPVAPTNSPAVAGPPVASVSPAAMAMMRGPVEREPEILLTGLVQWKGMYLLLLSDGETVRSDSGRVGIVTPRYAVIDGRTNYWARVMSSDGLPRYPGGVAAVRVRDEWASSAAGAAAAARLRRPGGPSAF